MSYPSSKYFSPHELIQPSLFKRLTECALMKIIGTYNLSCLDMLRNDYEQAVRLSGRFKEKADCYIYINGNYCGQEFKYSGLRAIDAPYAENSKHKNGNTFDLKCRHMSILLDLVLENWRTYSIERIESPEYTVFRGYLHTEFGISDELTIFKP